jgi:cellulose synthase/poly-beta-1,6-N-acetylglucosamine synthase-like glycosyltransferase
MTFLTRTVFWTCFLLTGYVYFLYPFLVRELSRIAGRTFIKDEILPRISIVITAFNEEENIGEKIENTLCLDYPADRREIIVGSDGSTDSTDMIVSSYEARGVRLVPFPRNRGKTMVQNDCVQEASGELIVFMDAASLCERDCLKKLASNFADRRVGAAAGRIVFTRKGENLTARSQGVYWRYEQILKKAEGSLGTLVGVDGPLYAVRRDLYRRLDGDMMSDFITPLLVISDGRSVVYEPEAVTYEEATVRTGDELWTRRRIVTPGVHGSFPPSRSHESCGQPAALMASLFAQGAQVAGGILLHRHARVLPAPPGEPVLPPGVRLPVLQPLPCGPRTPEG